MEKVYLKTTPKTLLPDLLKNNYSEETDLVFDYTLLKKYVMQTDTETNINTQTHTDTHAGTHRHADTHRDAETHRRRNTQTQKHTDTETHRRRRRNTLNPHAFH